MDAIPYLVLGWLLGLLSPRIVDTIRAHYDRKKFAVAIKAEAEDLQYRVAISGFLLRQRYGEINRDYLDWLKPKLASYRGNEPVDTIREFVAALLAASDEQLGAVVQRMRADEGMGLSLKSFHSEFMATNLVAVQSLSVSFQRCIHEFRNQLATLNQEIDRATESLRMTFDSSISGNNHARLVEDLNAKYIFIEGMCRRVCDRLQIIIEYDDSKI